MKDFFGLVGMNKLVCILLGFLASVIHILGCPAVAAFAIHPSMFKALVTHIALLIVEMADAVRAIGAFAAIERAAAQQ